jgi:cytochrome bd-type quinol oxidase subunit 1
VCVGKFRLNRGQRIVVVVALAGALFFVGSYVTTLGRSGWVAYAPLSEAANSSLTSSPLSGLHPWVRLVVWLVLIVVWAMTSLVLLRSSSSD